MLNLTIKKSTITNDDRIQDPMREAYIEILAGQPTRYHLTLTFKYGVNEKAATALLNTFLLYLNRAILKNRYNKGRDHLKGFVVKEATPSMDNIHFHMIISDESNMLPEPERMEEIIQKRIANANQKVAPDNRINRHLLQAYSNDDGSNKLEHYLTKNFERATLTEDQKINSICPLGHEGVIFDS